jgi:ATP-dependent Clp protease ATP-binding subunit ClpC
MVAQLNQNLTHKHLSVTVTDDAKQWILDKACKDKNYGARPLRRAIQRYIEDPLSEALIQGQLKDVANVEVYLEGTQLWYRSGEREEVGVPLTM